MCIWVYVYVYVSVCMRVARAICFLWVIRLWDIFDPSQISVAVQPFHIAAVG